MLKRIIGIELDQDYFNMKIQNLERANQLAKEMKEMNMAIRLLQGGGVVRVCGNGTFAVVQDRKTKDKILKALFERNEEIEIEVETL